ncbi:protein kinase [Bradyrhizobium sp. 160]|uniref:protein kinase domain-containing protein n=1 Tax=Bradyrhizobium sp. 160 TaxID=2782634 RepID=UPI002111A7A7|nr:protein kinase [Bradyrhizobium sp. 160]
MGRTKKLHAEPQALMSLQSPYVLQVLEAGYAGNEWAYFVTPHCAEGDLDNLLQANQTSNLAALDKCSNILMGLAELHGRRLLHRDIKPENVYLHNEKAIIGDFGSIAKLPEGNDAVVASKHAVLYRPPESVVSNTYGFGGDIYQCGVVLYQLLGGALPYDEINWLNKTQKLKYQKLPYPDSTLYADDCIRERIAKGRLLDFSTINAWAPDGLVKIARRACSRDPKARFSSVAEFLARLSETRAFVHDWKRTSEDELMVEGSTSYLIKRVGQQYRILKRKSSSEWRSDNTITGGSDLKKIVRDIEAKL